MLTASLCLSLLAPQGTVQPPVVDHVVINEFVYDDTQNPDVREFVELYNPTAATVDISGWLLDSEDALGPNTAYPIPGAAGSGTTTIGPGAYYVMGSALVRTVHQIVGSTDLWENGSTTGGGESLTLRDDTGAIVDTLVYESNKGTWDPTLLGGEGIWGNHRSVDDPFTCVLYGSPPLETSWARIRDGWDTGDNGLDFVNVPSTPGLSNNLLGALPYADDYNSYFNEQCLIEFGGGFEFAHAVDPTIVGGINLNVIPASPDGGNAAIFAWDYIGNGGNISMLTTELTGPAVFEAWVYFDATLELSGDIETWSLGLGTVATFANHPDPSGARGFTANGNVGVSWIYQSDDTSAVLYLVDHNNGGWGPGAVTTANVIGQITIQPGVNDGWRRLRLERNAGAVVGSFDNTPGCANGTTFTAPIGPLAPATFYVAYREGIAVFPALTARPPTFDDVSIHVPSSAVSFFGTAVATTAGTPTIGVNAPPTIGIRNWSVQMSGLVPSGITALILGTVRAPAPIPFVGGQPGSFIEVLPLTVITLPTDPTGNASLSFTIRCNQGSVGVPLYWQNFDPDLALPFSLPFGNSQGMQTTLGQ